MVYYHLTNVSENLSIQESEENAHCERVSGSKEMFSLWGPWNCASSPVRYVGQASRASHSAGVICVSVYFRYLEVETQNCPVLSHVPRSLWHSGNGPNLPSPDLTWNQPASGQMARSGWPAIPRWYLPFVKTSSLFTVQKNVTHNLTKYIKNICKSIFKKKFIT